MDITTRRNKQQQLMVRIVERKVRERAQQLYDERGQQDGYALNDWVQAESEVVGENALGKLYRRLRIAQPDDAELDYRDSDSKDDSNVAAACETIA